MAYIPIVPPKKAKCFQCTKDFYIKFVVPRKSYSKKNNWEYWTNPQAKSSEFWQDKETRKQNKHICDSCLANFYCHKELYLKTITDSRIRNKLRFYIYSGLISV